MMWRFDPPPWLAFLLIVAAVALAGAAAYWFGVL